MSDEKPVLEKINDTPTPLSTEKVDEKVKPVLEVINDTPTELKPGTAKLEEGTKPPLVQMNEG